MSDHDIHYPPEFIAKLEMLWGDGFLSPGGPAEVAEILTGLDLSGQHVLDIGCGVGGIDVLLAEIYGAETVVGIDVEDPVLDRARERVAERGLEDRITFQRVEPGPLPFEEASFDTVFTKDAMIHIPDKQALYADVLRILRPGGLFVGSDWLKGFSRAYSDTMKAWIKGVGLQFQMASVEETHQAWKPPVSSVSRSEAATTGTAKKAATAQAHRRRAQGKRHRPARRRRPRELGDDAREHDQGARRGEFCPSHIRARRRVEIAG